MPCHNDLLAANYLDDGEHIWIVDYEYSGNHDAAFELGNTCTECEFPPERLEAYAAAYYGTPTRGDVARVRLGALRSAYGWALWGFIQAASSKLDFDFHGWGMHRFEKAARTFTSDGFDRLLAEAEALPTDVLAVEPQAPAARRLREDRPCEICGTIIPNAHGRQLYCSMTCKTRAWRLRRRRRATKDSEP